MRRAVTFISLFLIGEARTFPVAFTHSWKHAKSREIWTSVSAQAQREHWNGPLASLVNADENEEQENALRKALRRAGFRVEKSSIPNEEAFAYQFSRATGMLKLLSSPASNSVIEDAFQAPRWISVVSSEENVLVANGWSFLDPDDNDPLSPFDVDAANQEGLYHPKWGQGSDDEIMNQQMSPLSSLGFSLKRLSSEEVQQMASEINPSSRLVLLNGKTDPPQVKTTQNSVKFTGPTGQADIGKGVFTCAIGGLPLFTTIDLSPTTVSAGWLSFVQPIAQDHVVLVPPEHGSPDQRIEVICTRTGCHLGHYFGKGNGFCINASALNFIPQSGNHVNRFVGGPESWRQLESVDDNKLPSVQLLRNVLERNIATETIVLGAGCFWHVEFAIRRLPGVISTEAGYAGGTTTAPTYADVCEKETGHAEVVKVTFDPRVLRPRILLDCFLSLHDPTKVRAHGKQSAGTGQYRSCIVITKPELERIAHEAVRDCSLHLGKELGTEIRLVDADSSQLFWRAEDYHQRHHERRRDLSASNLSTLSAVDWLSQYGRRSSSVLGSSETMVTAITPRH